MKSTHFIFLLCLGLFLSCEKEGETPTDPVEDNFKPSPTTTVLKAGDFANVAHKVTGKATIYQTGGMKTLVLDPFTTENGPDLYVYLSSDAKASKFVSLGKLKSTNGKQSYEISSDTMLDDFSYAIVWCQDFSVNFGNAELK
jgi:hypothetical protein